MILVLENYHFASLTRGQISKIEVHLGDAKNAPEGFRKPSTNFSDRFSAELRLPYRILIIGHRDIANFAIAI